VVVAKRLLLLKKLKMRLKMAVLVGKWSLFEGDCWPMFNCWYIFLFKYNVQFSNLKFTICGVSIFEMSQFSMLPNSMLPANRSKILHFGKWNLIAEIERNIFSKKVFLPLSYNDKFFTKTFQGNSILGHFHCIHSCQILFLGNVFVEKR